MLENLFSVHKILYNTVHPRISFQGILV